MTTLPKFKDQYEKIIQAYFKDEIKPYEARFCFCGTLCDNKPNWVGNSYEQRHNDYGDYMGFEYVRMEQALFKELENVYNYEDALFAGMCAALEVLKAIHQEHGEVIEDAPVLTKRSLQTP